MKRRRGYHFTHIDNLEAVLTDRALRCDSSVQQFGSLVRETADAALKEKRRRIAVPRTGGVLADYVPFYFAPRSPMLLNLATGRVAGYHDGQDPLVFVVVDIDRLIDSGHVIAATDGHPVDALTEFLPNRVAIESEVDWELMVEEYWNNTDADGDRKRRRQAEFLIKNEVPLHDVEELVVRTRAMAGAVVAKLRSHDLGLRVSVRPGSYYEGKP